MHTRDSSDSTRKWALRVAVAFLFAFVGIDKFSSAEAHWIHVFDAIGLGQWFRYFTGAVEVLGGLLFLVPPLTILGAGLLASAMLGAMAVNIFVFRRPGDSLFPALFLVGVVVAFMQLRTTAPRAERRG